MKTIENQGFLPNCNTMGRNVPVKTPAAFKNVNKINGFEHISCGTALTFFLFRCAGHPTVQYGPSQFRGLQSWRALLFRSPRHLPDSSAIRLRLIGWEQPMKNDFLRVTRFSVTVALYTCRPDLVGFVNGPPLVVIELKRFGGSSPPSAFVK